VLLALALAGQVDSIRAANHPDLRAIEALVAAVTGFLVLFALLYLGLAQTDSANFTQPLGRVSALYFTVTVLATVGFGDITAQTDGARLLVTVQMLLGLGLVAGLVRVFSAAARAGAARAHWRTISAKNAWKTGSPKRARALESTEWSGVASSKS